jgi:hypothetical protein
MPGEPESHGGVTEKIEGIPLYQLPKTIKELITRKRDAVFQIIIERKFHGGYTVIIETRNEHARQEHRKGRVRPEGDGHG